MVQILLTKEEIEKLNAGAHRPLSCIGCDIIALAQVKKVMERLEDLLENSFVMAYAGEDAPYEPTIDPQTMSELITELRQVLLKV